MVMYLKNQAGYKQSYFKGMKYEEIRPIFEKETNYEQEKAELRSWLKVAQDDEESVNPEILSTKYPIVDWEYQLLAFLEDLTKEDLSTPIQIDSERIQITLIKDLIKIAYWGDTENDIDPDEKE
ncbi:hypothetical protein Tco_1356667 [Tanacetum coccineum]